MSDKEMIQMLQAIKMVYCAGLDRSTSMIVLQTAGMSYDDAFAVIPLTQ